MSTRESLSLGQRGEEFAAQYFLDRGANLIARNVHYRCGEIDLIVVEGEDEDERAEVVFVEVKTRSSLDFGGAEAVDEKKLRRMRQAAATWLHHNAAHLMPVRFDVLVLFPEEDVAGYEDGGDITEFLVEHHVGVCDGAC